MPIRNHLKDHAAFEPETIDAMSKALEKACTALHIDGEIKDREIVAVRIIDLAAQRHHQPRDIECARDRGSESHALAVRRTCKGRSNANR
jgi:hypothetical protein